MESQPISLDQKLRLVTQHWAPKVVAQMNDYHFKVVKFQGEFVWHSHETTDEVFIVIAGTMNIHFRDRVVPLDAGELFVVPRGVEHMTSAATECHALLIEPAGIVNTGTVRSERTAPTDEWI